MPLAAGRLLHRVDVTDHDLLDRWSLRGESHRAARGAWMLVTQAGSAAVTIALVVVPYWLAPWPRRISIQAGLALAISHLLVQCIKRRVSRERPTDTALIRCPDRFSFPSGHATAILAVALTYALAFPAAGGLLMVFAALAGWSRVVLGVHFPSDVLAGQLLAVVTVVAVRLLA